jgi:hypothetical protein
MNLFLKIREPYPSQKSGLTGTASFYEGFQVMGTGIGGNRTGTSPDHSSVYW